MTTMTLEDHLLTESRNPRSESIDTLSPLEIVRLMNSEDAKVVEAVGAEAESIARAIEWAADRLRRGGRLIYVGAGTSGRLGVLDAAECPPTFSTPPGMVVGLIAGGPTALTRAIEGAEDDPDRGAADIAALEVGKHDLVVGIATSGRTPYVLGAVREARRRGAATVGLACNRPSLLGGEVDLEIAPLVGAEIIAGSTRLKAGTATKMILNMISTGAMVRIGKTLGNRMVDLKPSNEKLRIRSRRILRELAGVDDALAAQILARCGGQLETGLGRCVAGVDPNAAQRFWTRTAARSARRSRLAAGETRDDGSTPRTSVRLLGIDGGGTATEAWLAEPGCHVLGRGTAGPSNAKAVGPEAARGHSMPRSAARFKPPGLHPAPVMSFAWDWLDSTGPTTAKSSPDGPTRRVGLASL